MNIIYWGEKPENCMHWCMLTNEERFDRIETFWVKHKTATKIEQEVEYIGLQSDWFVWRDGAWIDEVIQWDNNSRLEEREAWGVCRIGESEQMTVGDWYSIVIMARQLSNNVIPSKRSQPIEWADDDADLTMPIVRCNCQLLGVCKKVNKFSYNSITHVIIVRTIYFQWKSTRVQIDHSL